MKIIKLLTLIFFSLFSNSLISQVSVGGILNSSVDNVCYGTNSLTLSLTGKVGDVQYWEMSNSLDGPWLTISNINSNLIISNLTGTTYFRAIVLETPPADTSSIKKIIVSELSKGGFISENTTVCAAGNNGNLQLNNYTGNINNWEYSNDLGINWNNINNTTNEYTFTNLSQTTWYRAKVINGSCPEINSEIAIVTVNPQTNSGTLIGIDSICSGNNSGKLILNSYLGDIIRWELSFSGSEPWISIESQNDTLQYENLLQTAYYRVFVKSGICEGEYSNIVELYVSSQTQGGIVSGQEEVCSGSNNGTVLLSDYTGNIQNWQYSFDNGTTWNDTANISHTLNYSNLEQTTTYRAIVNSGACGIDSSEICTIVVHPKPIVSFQFDTVCFTHPTTFINNTTISTGNIVNNSWDFGNGDGNNSFNPIYTYSAHGNYTVKLVAMSNHSCIDSAMLVVPVKPSPIVSFVTENVCDGDTTFFTNYSFTPSGSNLIYNWDFGDNTFSNDENPNHTYSNFDNYNVNLVVTQEDSGCSDSLSLPLSVYPRANVSFLFNNVCEGNSVNYQNTSFLMSGSASYNWEFGDGQNSTLINPQHSFEDAGEYHTILSVITNNNCIDTTSNFIYINPIPHAAFSSEDVCYTDSSFFINETSYTNNDISYSWNFGNGFSSNEESPDYYYSSPGNYLVSLNVTTDSLCQSEFSKFVNIYDLPDVDFTADNVCLNQEIEFQNQTTFQSGTVEYLWDFGNNETSTTSNPNVLYSEAGSYDIKLTATIGGMCKDSIQKQISIYPLPTVDFISENVCDGELSNFFDATTIESGSINNFDWDFGDGTNSVQQNPAKQFLNPGTYQVNLSVTSNFGCNANLTKPITIDFMPLSNFVVNNVCDGFPINPINQSYIESGQMFYHWTFGDNDTSILSAPNHMYENPGIFRLRLLVSSENGCLDSLVRYVQVYDLPQVYAGPDQIISKGDKIQLNSIGGAISNWSPSTYLSNPSIANPVCNTPQTIDYILQSEDLNGCINSDTIKIEVLDDFKLSPNNIITPDGNGINDTWIINNIENYSSCTVNIFDRMGTLVFSKQGYNNDWNGENIKGDILPDGTYYYVLSFEESSIVYKGSVSILRNK